MSTTDAGAGEQQQGQGQGPPLRQELRLAMTFSGGVSLAVWMGGLAREVNVLTQASRRAAPVDGESAATTRLRTLYQRLLDAVGTDVTVDVLCGTSAGGINAALLGVANARGADLGALRDIWLQQGSIEALLRDPSVPNPPSLLQGDGVLLAGLDEALRPGGQLAKAPADPAGRAETTVLVTTTLQRGEACHYTDDFETVIRDTDHHGVFQFTAEQLAGGDARTLRALALAARSSASFPAAFEPAFLPIGADADDAHPDMAPYASTRVSQFAADGGLLVNFPLEPTLKAIYNRPITGDYEVRRVLAYVVPSVDGKEASTPKAPTSVADTPALVPAILADLTAVHTQSISGALLDLQRHNDRVDGAAELRRQLAALAAAQPLVTDALYDDFRRRLVRDLAVPIAREITSVTGDDAGHAARLRTAESVVVARLAATLPSPFGATTPAELAAFGWPAVRHAYGTLRAILRAALLLCPADDETARQRTAIVSALKDASGAVSVGPLPPDVRDVVPPTAQPGAVTELTGAWLTQSLGTADPDGIALAWQAISDALTTTDEALGTLLARFATVSAAPAGTAGRSVAERRSAAAGYVGVLRSYLGYRPAGAPERADVPTALLRLLELYVAERAMLPTPPEVEQPVELVAMSSDTRTLLDDRMRAADKLTGLQMFHFGAFYKSSWRASDWMWGRLDGCGWLVHVLLDPRRLRAIADQSGGGDFRAALYDQLAGIAGTLPDDRKAAVLAELAFLADESVRQPTSLPTTSMWVASALQREIAADELGNVAKWVRADAERSRTDAAAKAFLRTYAAATGGAGSATVGDADDPPAVPIDQVDVVLAACRVSAERITDDIGSQRFVQTVAKAGAVVGRITEQPARRLPTPLAAVSSTIGTAVQLGYQVTRASFVAKWASIVGGGAVLLGLIASTSSVSWLSTAGVLAALVGAIVIALGMTVSAWRLAIRILLGVVALLLALAGWMGATVKDHVFGWLDDTALPALRDHPALWFFVIAFLAMPAVVTTYTLATAVVDRARRPRPTPAPAAPEVGAARPPALSGEVPAQRDPTSETERGGAPSGAPTS